MGIYPVAFKADTFPRSSNLTMTGLGLALKV